MLLLEDPTSKRKPIYRRNIVYPSNISILVVLKVLGNLIVSIKELIVI